MSDRERGLPEDEDRLPWLEPVEDEDEDGGPGTGRLIAAVIAGLLVIGLVVGGVMWLRNGEPEGTGALIAAPEGDYKIPAEGPSADGMAIEGEGDAAYVASEGADLNTAIDTSRKPEAPLAGMAAADAAAVRVKELPPSSAAPAPATAAATRPPPAPQLEPARSAPVPTAKGGATIQLGAFGSEATANTEWSKLSRQFPGLNSLSRTVTPVSANGKTLYRLRVSGPDAKALCDQVKAAGKPCNVVAG